MAYTYEQAMERGADPGWAARYLPRTAPATYRGGTYFNPDAGRFEYTPTGYSSGAAYEESRWGEQTRLPGWQPPTAAQQQQMAINRRQPIYVRGQPYGPGQPYYQPSTYAPAQQQGADWPFWLGGQMGRNPWDMFQSYRRSPYFW